jgi:hypothetical protein
MTNEQFWIQTAVQIASAVAAVLVAILAIWGDAIRARLVGPKLTLRLFDPSGERINLTGGSHARYYHMRVANERKSARAHNVRVVLTRVRRPSADGTFPPDSLSGPVQLTWQHGHSLPQYPTIGPAINCDLGCIVKDQAFFLTTMFVPNNLDVQVRENQRIVIEAIAVSDETESNPLCVEISWNGKWSEDTKEMANHLVVKEVPCT